MMKAPRDEIGQALIALKQKGYPIVAIDSDLATDRPVCRRLSGCVFRNGDCGRFGNELRHRSGAGRQHSLLC